ncbi:MAG: hypothetical protein A3I78_02305 [Gammaproteobacteria bacterium RIFCSPLOWO2_02_FULL_56_15]|nr:MAG: hypothetical protein A3I78_02305 [Gammaproteobacteria bacterium RIFCSPLOWO2_02_FULL_56_15]
MDLFWGTTLILMLPAAAMSGWLASQKSLRAKLRESQNRIPPEYLAGLNFVLNEEQDKAIDLFIKLLEVDSQTVETHLALGNLFRRRGEVDRAIRIHQNLIARPQLSAEHRALALLELGTDYMRSGLLDRAEGLFCELVDNSAYSEQALRALLDIYQQEKDWQNAIGIACRLESVSGDRLGSETAQFYCELASEAIKHNDFHTARQHLHNALDMDKNCARASLIEAGICKIESQPAAAIDAYRKVGKQDPDYLPEVTGPLFECYREIGKLDEYRDYLHEVVATIGGITPLLCLTDLTEELEGRDAAAHYLASELDRRPAVRGVHRLVEYALASAEGDMQRSLYTIRQMTERLIQGKSVYKCKQCGFAAKNLHWQCPGCKCWNTIKPVFGVEGE